MNFFRILLVLILMIFSKVSLADNHDQKKEELVEQLKEMYVGDVLNYGKDNQSDSADEQSDTDQSD